VTPRSSPKDLVPIKGLNTQSIKGLNTQRKGGGEGVCCEITRFNKIKIKQ